MKRECGKFADDLSALVDGELPVQLRAEVEVHVAGCVDCRTRVAELRKLSAGIAAIPKAQTSPQFLTEVRRKISEGAQPRDASWWEMTIQSPWVQVPVRVAAIVAILVGIAALITPAYHSYLAHTEQGKLAKAKRPVEVAARLEPAAPAAAVAQREGVTEPNQSMASPPPGLTQAEEKTVRSFKAAAPGEERPVDETIVVVDADASRVQAEVMKVAASLGGRMTRTIDDVEMRVYVELPAGNVGAFRQRVLWQYASADRRLKDNAGDVVEGRADVTGRVTERPTNEPVSVLEIRVVTPAQ